MKIHSDVLWLSDIRDAAAYAGVTIEDLDQVGSRSRARAFKVYLSGSNTARANGRDHMAATWDEWGIFLARLFLIDPRAHCGKHSYQSAAHFHWTTGDRFTTLTPSWQHGRHRWEPRELFEPGFARAHSYAESWCDCGAVQRWPVNSTWNTDTDTLART